jgi:hypothetical protein
VMVGASGGLTGEVSLMAGAGLPVVLLGTWFGRRYPPAFGEATMRRLAFGMLLAMGLWIALSAVRALTS